jgi:branched-chain amino acid transport system ATP-binding protein
VPVDVTSPAALLEVRDVTVRFGGLVALNEVSASVAPNEVVGVIGPNGAGKTTLFNVICGFNRPARGSLQWRGQPLRRHRPRQLARLGIARTLQGLGLFPHLSVLDNVMVGATRHSRAGVGSALLALPRGDRDEHQLRERSLATLEGLDVGDVADRLPGELPYGVQKRVALARALVAEPQLLLLDEPASGLSSAELQELAALVRELRAHMGIMLVEHHMDLVMQVCDRLVVLDFGRVIATGTPDDVRGDDRVLEAYLGEQIDESTQPRDASGGADDARG